MKYLLLCAIFPLFVYAQQADSVFFLPGIEVQTLTAGYITSNPRYDIKDILALQQGVTLLDGQIHIRGARSAQTNYFLDGVFSNDIMFGGNGVYLIPSALDRVNLFIDHTPSGLAVGGGGAIMARIKKGGKRFEAHLNVQGDGFVPHGQSFFNTYSYGQRIITASIGGPLANGAIHYFIAAENNYKSDAMQRYNSGFRFDNVPVQNSSSTVSLSFPQGYTPHSQSNLYALNGALDFDFWGNALRISGSASRERRQNDSRPWLHIFNDRIPLLDTKSAMLSAQFSRRIGKTSFLKVQAGYYKRFSETSDSYLGNDWMSWYDSSKVAEHGATFRDAWRPQYNISIYNLSFSTKGRPQGRYSKNSQISIFSSLDFEQKLGQRHLLHSGLSVRSYTLRHYSISPSVMFYAAPPEYGDKIGIKTVGRYQDISVYSWIRNGGLDAYGYDVYGQEINKQKTYNEGDAVLAPIRPLFSSAFIEDTYHFQHTTVRAGFRMDYFDFNNKILKDPTNIRPTFTGFGINSDNWKKGKTAVRYNPYISIKRSLNNHLLLFSEYVQASQPTTLNKYYRSDRSIVHHLSSSSIPAPVSSIQPIDSRKINAGLWYLTGAGLTLTGEIFYHNYRSLSGVEVIHWSSTLSFVPRYIKYSDRDEANIYGLDLSLSFNHLGDLWAQMYYSYQNGLGRQSDKSIYSQIRNFRFTDAIRPLDNLSAHSGALILNYIFRKQKWGNWLADSHFNLFVNFNSGHAYTLQSIFPHDISSIYNAGVDLMTPYTYKNYVEPVNASTTPWVINTDLSLDKSIEISEKLGLTFFLRVTNLFNRKNVINVYETTGSATDDGAFENSTMAELSNRYGPEFKEFYKAVVQRDGNAYRSLLGKELFGRPRQIFAGIKLAY